MAEGRLLVRLGMVPGDGKAYPINDYQCLTSIDM